MLRLAEAPLADSGETSVPAEQVGQAILASSAFPVAFSPRDLCTCESACPSERIVNNGTCPGPGPGHPLTGLTCAGLSSSKEQLKLCRWEYVDGGIFDNAPLGLAIDELESWQAPAPLRPVFYAFMDPDLRRSQSSTSKPPGAWAQGFSGYLQLFGNLISTSRNADLARAITAKNWNRTTESLLRELALTLSQFAFLYQQFEGLSDRESLRAGETMPTSLPRLAKRKRTGRALYQCLERLHNVRQIQSNLAFLAHCSQAVEELKSALSAIQHIGGSCETGSGFQRLPSSSLQRRFGGSLTVRFQRRKSADSGMSFSRQLSWETSSRPIAIGWRTAR
jgi:hypothetical protein